jgi:hypothetical protein
MDIAILKRLLLYTSKCTNNWQFVLAWNEYGNMGWNTYLQPKQQQHKQRLYPQLLYRIVAILIVISILIAIYFQIWSKTGIFFAASPIGLVTTKPIHHIKKDGLGLEQEQLDADSAELVLSSSCLWDPFDGNTSCTDLLSQHISSSLM